jgi:aldehyde dehydrogenase (NAD+)
LQAQYELFIDGKWQAPLSNTYFDNVNPADERHLTKIAWGNAADIDLAVCAARTAYDNVWSKLSGAERGKYLFRIARLMQEKAKELAILETLDGGKPIRESRDIDIPLACNHFFYYAGWADKLQEAFAGQQVSALGVAGQITPWNFPLLMLAWKVAPALACGNTVVLKPAETTSLTALKFAEICQEAGLPAGVVNIVTGYGDTGAALVAHPDVDKIAFTGSTAVGKHIQKACIGTAKKLTLELGGKSANIILEDAPIDQAVEGVINSIFFNQGHVCCAGSRLFVQESIAERVLEKLKFRLQSIYVGHPLDKITDIRNVST